MTPALWIVSATLGETRIEERALTARLKRHLAAEVVLRLRSFRHHADRMRFLLARLRALEAPERRCGPDLRRCAVIGPTASGQPLLQDYGHRPAPTLCFSWSHSGDLCVASASGFAHGIDTEPTGRAARIKGLVPRMLAPDETAPRDEDGALRSWTAKEAVLKTLGTGFRTDPRRIRLHPKPDAPEQDDYQIRFVGMDDSHMIALATPAGRAVTMSGGLFLDPSGPPRFCRQAFPIQARQSVLLLRAGRAAAAAVPRLIYRSATEFGMLQIDESIALDTDPLLPDSQSRTPRARPIVVATVLCALIGAALAGRYWWMRARFVQTTDDAQLVSDIASISAEVGGQIVSVLVPDHAVMAAGTTIAKLEDALSRGGGRPRRRYARRARSHRHAGGQDRASTSRGVGRNRRSGRSRGPAGSGASLRRSHREAGGAGLGDAGERGRNADGSGGRHALRAPCRGRPCRRAGTLRAAVQRTQEPRGDTIGRRTALDLARIDLGLTLIRAQVAGVLGNRGVASGGLVGPGQKIFSLVPLDSLYVVANFKETQVAGMHVGQPVENKVAMAPGSALSGTLESLSPATGAQFSILAPDNAKGNFTKIVQRVPVRIRLADTEPAGRQGRSLRRGAHRHRR